jgi:hypothetical protein
VGREPRRMREKSCAWVLGMRSEENGGRLGQQGRGLGLRDECPERAELVS